MNGFNQPAAMYTFGGGNFPRDFTIAGDKSGRTYQTFQMGAQGPELSPMAKQLGTQVLPAGTTSRQESRYLLDEAKRSGRPYVEAPESYTRGSRELDRYGRQKDPTGLYNQQGERFSGTTIWNGGRATEEPMVPSPQPSPKPNEIMQPQSLTDATGIRESQLGQSGDPLAFTGFGKMARDQKADQYQTPIGQGLSSLPSTSPTLAAAGVPRFPYAGAESAFERTTREANTFGSAPMFPSSRFGGPQPNERTGPVATQPRRSWMY
jgi:hypothetical protein